MGWCAEESSRLFLTTTLSRSSPCRHLRLANTEVGSPSKANNMVMIKSPVINILLQLKSWCCSWWRPNIELKESEYWTCVNPVARKTAPNERYICSVAAGCVKQQLFANKFTISTFTRWWNVNVVSPNSCRCPLVAIQLSYCRCNVLQSSFVGFVLHPALCLSLPLRHRLPEVPLPSVCQVQPLPPLLHVNRTEDFHLQLLEWWDSENNFLILLANRRCEFVKSWNEFVLTWKWDIKVFFK